MHKGQGAKAKQWKPKTRTPTNIHFLFLPVSATSLKDHQLWDLVVEREQKKIRILKKRFTAKERKVDLRPIDVE